MESEIDSMIPTFNHLLRIAPITILVLLCAAAGWWARGDSIKHLRDWINDLIDRKK